MKNLTISIFGSKVFPEIIKEIDLFSNAKIVFHENHEDIASGENSKDRIIVYFLDFGIYIEIYKLNLHA